MSRFVLVVVSLVAVLFVTVPREARAATAQFANARVTDGMAANSSPVTEYPSGGGVYFHVTVVVPDTGITHIGLEQYVNGAFVLTKDFSWDQSGMFTPGEDVPFSYIQPSGTPFPDGQYCVYVKLDGSYTDATGSAPVAFGIGIPPRACPSAPPPPTVARVSRFSVTRRESGLVIHWHVASTSGILGFNVYARSHRLNTHLIQVHASQDYRVIERWIPGPYRVAAVTSSPSQSR